MKRRTFVTTLFLSAAATPLYAQFGIPSFDPLKKLQDKATEAATGQPSAPDEFDSAGKLIKGLAGIGAKEEAAIGGAVAIEILSTYGKLVRDEAITRRVNLVGKTLSASCERPELPYRFGVYDSATPNAFSAPGGYVFISRGLYDICKTDDQLAGVLAHEIIHISRRHALRIISRNEAISGVVGVAHGTSSDFAAFDVGVGNLSKTILKGGYDHGSEYDADKFGRALAKSEGFQQDGLLESLKTLETSGAEKRGAFNTHPSLESRIERLSSGDSSSSSEKSGDSSSDKKSINQRNKR